MLEQFLEDSGARYPIIGAPMYPCSNADLVAAVSNAGGIGIIQPITLTYVEDFDLREGIKYIKSLTSNPIGMNVLIENNSKKYRDKMDEWIDIALSEGILFFITSLGKPEWVVHKVHPYGAKVYHDVIDISWAKVAIKSGVDGLIAVNYRSGGHAGNKNMLQLIDELSSFKLPIICAGGISDKEGYQSALNVGYSGILMGTRFIATEECSASNDYKQAIVDAHENDIIKIKNVMGTSVSVINTSYIQGVVESISPLSKWMLKYPKFKHMMRKFYVKRSLENLKKSLYTTKGNNDFWQAGKSVHAIMQVQPVKKVFDEILSQ